MTDKIASSPFWWNGRPSLDCSQKTNNWMDCIGLCQIRTLGLECTITEHPALLILPLNWGPESRLWTFTGPFLSMWNIPPPHSQKIHPKTSVDISQDRTCCISCSWKPFFHLLISIPFQQTSISTYMFQILCYLAIKIMRQEIKVVSGILWPVYVLQKTRFHAA